MRYEIKGETLPVVICYLDAGEKIITENGGMSWMSPNMEMKTSSNGGIGKMFGRMFSGERMFQNISLVPLKLLMYQKGIWFCRKKRSWRAKQEWSCLYSLIRELAPAYLAVKVLSCRDCQARVLLLLNLMDM